MKVLFSHYGVYKKGGWGRTFALAKGLKSLGEDVTIITSQPGMSPLIEHKSESGVRIIVFPEFTPLRYKSKGYGILSLFLKLFFVFINKHEIVISDEGHRPLSGFPCIFSKWLHHSIYISEWWDFFGQGGQYDSKSRIFKLLFGRFEIKNEIEDKKKADGVVVLSEVMREKAIEIKEIENLIKIHGGADVDAIRYIEDNKEIKSKLGFEENTLTFGYIDALYHSLEEISPFIEAIKELSKQHKIKLILFGSSLSFEVKEKLFLDNLIYEFGWVDFEKDYEKLACVDVFVLIKKDTVINRAGWPNSLGDYFATGRPVLINPIGETVDFCNKYSKGLFISDYSYSSIYAKVQEIIYLQNDLVKIGKHNLEIAKNIISWEQRSAELKSFYIKILNQ